MFKEAKQTASTIEYSGDHAYYFRNIATAEAKVRMKEQAMVTFKEGSQTVTLF